jgi:hypothetical protein
MQITQTGQTLRATEVIENKLVAIGLDAEAPIDVNDPEMSPGARNALTTYVPGDDPKAHQADHLVELIALGSQLLDSKPCARAARYIGAIGEGLIAARKPDDAADRRYLLGKLVEKVRSGEGPQNATRAVKLMELFRQSGQLCRDVSGIVNLDEFEEVYVVSDLHGGGQSLKRIRNAINLRSRGKGTALVFLGDYSNNGLESIAVLQDVLTLHVNEPDRVFLLRGNHETPETFATAVKEMFITHWDHALELPDARFPPGHCYGNLRLEVVSKFNYESGARVYGAFAAWANELPCAARLGKTLLSHSVGLPAWHNSGARITRIPSDERELECLGYEEWKRRSATVLAAMLNNREFDKPRLIGKLKRAFGVERFIVGHSHTRSGVILPISGSDIVTLCSSDSSCSDAGHYMTWEYQHARRKSGPLEGIGPGPARPVYGKIYRSGAFELIPVP